MLNFKSTNFHQLSGFFTYEWFHVDKFKFLFLLLLDLQIEAENVMMLLGYQALLFIRFFLLFSRAPPSINSRPEAHLQSLDFCFGAENDAKEINNTFFSKRNTKMCLLLSFSMLFAREHVNIFFHALVASKSLQFYKISAETARELWLFRWLCKGKLLSHSKGGFEGIWNFFGTLRQSSEHEDVNEFLKTFLTLSLCQLYQFSQDVRNRAT